MRPQRLRRPFHDAHDIIEFYEDERDRLLDGSTRFARAMHDTSIPHPQLRPIMTSVATLRSPTPLTIVSPETGENLLGA